MSHFFHRAVLQFAPFFYYEYLQILVFLKWLCYCLLTDVFFAFSVVVSAVVVEVVCVAVVDVVVVVGSVDGVVFVCLVDIVDIVSDVLVVAAGAVAVVDLSLIHI